jgi:hypothetical protein
MPSCAVSRGFATEKELRIAKIFAIEREAQRG